MNVQELVAGYRERITTTSGYKGLNPLYRELVAEVDVLGSFDTISLAHDLLYWSGQNEEAAQVLEQGLLKFPENFHLMIGCAHRAIDAGRYSLVKQVADQLERIDPAHLDSEALRNVCRVFSAIGSHEPALVLFDRIKSSGSGYATDRLRSRLLAAIYNSELSGGIDVYALGEDSRPWMVLNRWGIRSNPFATHQMTTFSLEATHTNTVTNVLNELGRVSVTNRIEMVDEADGNQLPVNKELKIQFYHNRGDFWHENDFARLEQLYVRRTDNLFSSFTGGKRIYVHYSEQPRAYLHAFVEALRKRQRNEHYQIVVVSGATDSPTGLTGDDLTYARVTVPNHPFAWFAPDFFESAEGIEYERSIVQAVRDGVTKLLAASR